VRSGDGDLAGFGNWLNLSVFPPLLLEIDSIWVGMMWVVGFGSVGAFYSAVMCHTRRTDPKWVLQRMMFSYSPGV
jgi:hypothetical protein